MRVTDQLWINDGIRRLDDAIDDAAGALGLQVVDIYDTPNAFGHGLIADEVARALLSLPPGDLFNVRPGQTINHQFPVGPGPELDASTQWPGSDVVLSLTSPSGKRYTREAPGAGVEHLVGPTFETYRIPDPEPGEWTATLFGRQVAPQGEETRLTVHTPPAPNAAPVAAMTQTLRGRTVTVDASGSRDADGTVVEHVWDFGDGTTAKGVRATHTYATEGTYKATLAVQDDRGARDFTSATSTFTITKYAFSGFRAPVDSAPTLNAMQAGRAVPLKFTLGGDFGLGVLAAGSPSSTRVTCDTQAPVDDVESTTAAGGSSLTYDAATGQYTYVWKTETSWAGTCRRMTLTLDDGSTHSALFRFRL